MTDIEVYQDRALAQVDHQAAAIGRLSEWAQSAQAAMVVADQLSRSSFVPEQFRGKPGEATAAILAGLEVGLQPMAALQAFDVIQGRAAPRAITLRAVVQSHGHEMELVESTATRCKMRGRRRGASGWQDVVWTTDRAKGLNLLGKDNWKKQPQAMLVARATSELARLIASDAILGIGYSAEEVADGAGAGVDVPAITTADPDGHDSPTAQPGKKRMARKKANPQPDDESDIADAEVVEPDPDAVTESQIKKMMACFNEQGISDRGDRLNFVIDVIGRDVSTSKELTKGEASQVIEALVGADDRPPPPDDSDDPEPQLEGTS